MSVITLKVICIPLLNMQSVNVASYMIIFSDFVSHSLANIYIIFTEILINKVFHIRKRWLET